MHAAAVVESLLDSDASSKVYFTFVADLATCFAFKSYSLSIYDRHRLPNWHWYCARRRIHNVVVVVAAVDDGVVVAAGDEVSPCFDAA